MDEHQIDDGQDDRDPPVAFGELDFVFEVELLLVPTEERRARIPVLDLEGLILAFHLFGDGDGEIETKIGAEIGAEIETETAMKIERTAEFFCKKLIFIFKLRNT